MQSCSHGFKKVQTNVLEENLTLLGDSNFPERSKKIGFADTHLSS